MVMRFSEPSQVPILFLLMENAFVLLICSLPSIACVVGTIILAASGITGWGWLLFAAILTNPAILGIKIEPTSPE